jgi:heat-inducible transcriptional repressor
MNAMPSQPLTERQELILSLVVREHLEHGRPVSSKAVAESGEVSWGPSTIRAELAALEAAGLLTHPHTSAGRVPTESGYRYYAESLIESGEMPATREPGLELTRLRREIDETMRTTTAALAQVTDLVALVTAPPLETATIHRVEVLRLRPSVVMVVVITSTGVVRKRIFDFDSEVDRGLVEWASSYLNESLAGMSVGSRLIRSRLTDENLGTLESEFLGRLSTVFTNLESDPGEDLYVDGTASLLADASERDLVGLDQLMSALEGRATVLSMLRSALDQRSVYLWIGRENPRPEMRGVSVVGANYGLGHRNLGAVGVVGPVRMDYAVAIASVRDAARQLSNYFELVYET